MPPIQWVPGALSPGVKSPSEKLTPHLQLVPRSRKCESILSNRVLSQMSKWFSADKLPLNLDKTNIIFITKNVQYPLNFGYNEKYLYIEEAVKTKFLLLQIGNHLKWKNHIDWLVPKLSRACYAVRSMLHVSNTDTLKIIHFAYFHSLMKYGIIF
jgi:hypothetical protein